MCFAEDGWPHTAASAGEEWPNLTRGLATLPCEGGGVRTRRCSAEAQWDAPTDCPPLVCFVGRVKIIICRK